MRYLSDIIQEQQTVAFEEFGAFFAFSPDQFHKQKKPGVKYASMYAGMVCPTEHADALHDRLSTIAADGIKQDIEEHGVTNIILRELDNHEYAYTGHTNDTEEALSEYPGITPELIRSVARNNKIRWED